MIRPLRRRHRWIVPGLLALLIVAAVFALAHPAPSAHVDALPRSILDLQERPDTR
jgi:hypothetical protein